MSVGPLRACTASGGAEAATGLHGLTHHPGRTWTSSACIHLVCIILWVAEKMYGRGPVAAVKRLVWFFGQNGPTTLLSAVDTRTCLLLPDTFILWPLSAVFLSTWF